MNGGKITLTTAEQRRHIVLNHLEAGALVNAEAARLLGRVRDVGEHADRRRLAVAVVARRGGAPGLLERAAAVILAAAYLAWRKWFRALRR